MQGRQDQEPRDGFSGQYPIDFNGTGRQRAIPRRPPGMARIDHPPATSRVARPQREVPRKTNWRRRLLIWGIILVVCGVLACGIGYAAVNFFAATNAGAGPAKTAADFLAAISNQNYDQAYNDLDAVITIQLAPDDFKQQALTTDRCYGVVTNYSEVQDSAVQNNAQSYSLSYTITRSKLAKPYTLRMTVQQDSNGDWRISSYGNNNDLGPGQPPCS
jgi:hypothetical protein